MKPHRVQLYQQILSNYSGTMFNVVKVTHLSRSVFTVLKSAGDRRWTWCMSKLRPEATSSESVSTITWKLLKTEIHDDFGTR